MENIKYEIEKVAKTRTFYKFTEKNKKGESLTVEITEIYPENTSKNSLPNLWVQHGFTNKLYNSYLSVNCYVTDKDGNCWSRYNATEKLSDDGKRNVLNFDYLLEVSKENKKYLLDLIYEMFMAGTKETINKEEYKKLHKDYKEIIDGVHYVLKLTENGTCLVPVVVI